MDKEPTNFEDLEKLATRVPKELNHAVRSECEAEGVTLMEFVAEALTERLARGVADPARHDVAIDVAAAESSAPPAGGLAGDAILQEIDARLAAIQTAVDQLARLMQEVRTRRAA